jgi:cell division protein FtsQ
MAFIQERRWDLKLDNSVEVKLPDQNIDTALKILSIIIKDGQITSGDITKVDLRIEGKAIFTLSKSGQDYFQKIRNSQKL